MRSSILLGKVISQASKATNRSGSTWPGHAALKLDSNIISKILRKNSELKVVLVAGTNGKTTTAKLIQEVLEQEGKKVFRNAAGANLLNGIASTLIKHSNINGKVNYDIAIFEVDENSLPLILSEFQGIFPTRDSSLPNPPLTSHPHLSIILLNLFRDQLDRYGEVNTIAKNWLESLKNLAQPSKSQGGTLHQGATLITNGDDPMLRYIGENSDLHSFYFGLDQKFMSNKEASHDVDFLYCPNCSSKLVYSKRSYSHMGIYMCPKCKFENYQTSTFPDLPNPMFGIYNKYNINAAALLLQKSFGIEMSKIKETLEKFLPAFGRQEIINYQGKNIFLLLSKNPTGFNQSIEAILEDDKNPNVLLLLNDRIPDGRDVSWIWDVGMEGLVEKSKHITVSGDRCFDIALRVKYSSIQNTVYSIQEDLRKSIDLALNKTKQNETLYILATYSAMLETRKILKGRSIL